MNAGPLMSRICPNCNYVRKATDSAPEWQCPSCEIAYNKGAGAADMSDYGRFKPPAARSGRTGSPLLKGLLLLALVGAGVWVGKPLWHGRAQTSAVSLSAAQQPAVVLYATEWCGYCAAARSFFAANNIQFTELDVEKTAAGYEGHKKLGGNGVPLIVVGDNVIRGYNEGELRSTLKPWLKGS